MNRKRLFPLLVVLALISTAGAQELTGSWQGALEVMGAKLRLVFNFEKSDSGWTALLDSPDQGAKGIPCGQVRTPADSLIVEVPVVHGSYLALYSPDSLRYDGVWRQGGLELPLQLVKSDQPVQMNRPQEPRPPFPYRSEEDYPQQACKPHACRHPDPAGRGGASSGCHPHHRFGRAKPR